MPADHPAYTGIITKPDSLISGSESEKFFASLAQNKEVGFRLRWHHLKNLDSEKDSFSLARRDLEEKESSRRTTYGGASRHACLA